MKDERGERRGVLRERGYWGVGRREQEICGRRNGEETDLADLCDPGLFSGL
jgi:hypothetical protein